MPTFAETDRLILREWQPEADAEAALQIYQHPKVTRYLLTRMESVEQARETLRRWQSRFMQAGNGSGCWAIALKSTGELLGTVLLIPLRDEDEQPTHDFEIGWHLKYEAWGQGYATEAAQAVLSYGFNTLHLPEIYAVANPKNERSLQVMRRLGMTRLGRTNRYYNQELELFEIKAHAWQSQKSS
ncbi:MAG TPA: GNAT family N-acetyltransferase [Leptolyngbyaceae cyanobacterium M33_DOE_097]|uniref:N-acetyltransferase n=1 Tax=Oscillatoriales cyanobacterium SpSt-418 TaxID=2282169 RepID=A0A7C3KDL9_9CYAN|nr:GNAT family N-acetyltransferase [Leptolyngbyaceae cyanobacterium M33_DOE_097]